MKALIYSTPFEHFWASFAIFIYFSLAFSCEKESSHSLLKHLKHLGCFLVESLNIVDIVCHRARCTKVGVEPTECSARSTCKQPGQPGRSGPDMQSFAELMESCDRFYVDFHWGFWTAGTNSDGESNLTWCVGRSFYSLVLLGIKC